MAVAVREAMALRERARQQDDEQHHQRNGSWRARYEGAQASSSPSGFSAQHPILAMYYAM